MSAHVRADDHGTNHEPSTPAPLFIASLQDRCLLRGLDVHAEAGHIWSTCAFDEDGPSQEMPPKWMPLYLNESKQLVCEAVHIAFGRGMKTATPSS